jgi:hypothetical protein
MVAVIGSPIRAQLSAKKVDTKKKGPFNGPFKQILAAPQVIGKNQIAKVAQ